MKTFTPEKLNEAKREIVSLHKKTAQNKGTFSDSELKKLIQKIVSLEENKIKKYAIALSNDEVCAITKYIPANFYSVNCKNLFEVLKWRKNSKIMNVFYKEWQNNFRNAKCNFYIIDMIHEDSGFASYFAEMHLDTERLECILKSESIPGVFGNLCYTVQLPDNTSFDERMQFFGISKETMLYKDVKSLYYTFCSRNDYLATDEGELLRVLQRYAKEQIKAFLQNFLPLFSLSELGEYTSLAKYLLVVTSEDEKSKKWKDFFGDFSQELQRKYKYWTNSFRVDKYFGKDDRSLFWRDYCFERVENCYYSNSLLMEFENYYAIEFLGTYGPVYIYDKESGIFEEKINYWIHHCKNTDLRKALKDNRSLCVARMEHRTNGNYVKPDWYYHFKSYLKTHKIAKRFDE